MPASWYLPDGQWSQLVLRSMAAILPCSQSMHELPVEGWYWPMGQSVHAVASMEEYLPIMQMLH
jgi:hypothetical protein